MTHALARTRPIRRPTALVFVFVFVVVLFLVLSERDFGSRRVDALSCPVGVARDGAGPRQSPLNPYCLGNRDTVANNRKALVRRRSVLLRSSTAPDGGGGGEPKKIRLNKVFKRTHSRREADRLIEEGRVSVNGKKVGTKGGFFVVPYVDEISLDGDLVEGWEEMNGVQAAKTKTTTTTNPASAKTGGARNAETAPSGGKPGGRGTFEYIKYWKPRGVICTTDPKIPHNIVDELAIDGYHPPHRVYPVGRLDKDTSGIILVTSDGRLPNAALRKEHKRPKVYEVGLDRPLERHGPVLDRLREGVTISTETVRNGVRKTLTAPTEPCSVEQLSDTWIRITLREGRNRQVRKMTRAVGYRTVELERVSFAGIPLEPGLRGPGDWDYLEGEELEIVLDMIEVAEAAAKEASEAVPSTSQRRDDKTTGWDGEDW
ncbi:unnamed protein product [Pseudo-nitzschia multistriata]|uniref:Uncharacterized protein n=1 Tax=Pseudo-nitzschia multistriata TaxID=183589 RepID=A0A448ZQC7_9STRA|nr:unnamed protein product [Pseudo-nitzschia multistriata]